MYSAYHKHYCILFIILVFFSCKESEEETLPSYITSDIERMIHAGSLLIDTQEENEFTKFFFETDTIILPNSSIEQISMDKETWVSSLILKDQTLLLIPTLGTSLTNVVKDIKINPSGYSPLVAELQLSFPVRGIAKIIVEGKQGPQGDIIYVNNQVSFNHHIYVYGLYAGYNNNIRIIFTDMYGKIRAETTLNIETQPLGTISLPKIAVTKAQPEKMEPGLTLVNYLGENEFDTHCPFMIDTDGEIRWILLLKEHPEIGRITSHVGFQRMKNGNFIFGDVKAGRFVEADMLGNVIKTWDIKGLGYEFHHEVTEMPNGNLLATVSKNSSIAENGNSFIYDFVIELDREKGSLVKEWDLKKSLDQTRYTTNPDGELTNWAHNNAVVYSPSDDAIIVSLRYQGLIKLDRQNRVKWILAPHRGWGNNGLEKQLLNPIDRKGDRLTNVQIIEGEDASNDFDWSWGSHCPVILPNGNILVFDNGFFRHYKNLDLYSKEGYSRAVEYKIDESNMTIQENWQYGKERGRTCYAVAVSSVQYLPETNHVLFCPGLGCPNVNGVGGKIIEVDKTTKEIVYEVDLSTPNFMVFHRATRMSLYPTNQ